LELGPEAFDLGAELHLELGVLGLVGRQMLLKENEMIRKLPGQT
jgi:hypothetical protein